MIETKMSIEMELILNLVFDKIEEEAKGWAVADSKMQKYVMDTLKQYYEKRSK